MLLFAPAVAAQQPSLRTWGFAAPWDAQSDTSIAQHGHQLDVVVSGWIGLDSASGRPLLPSAYGDSVRTRRGSRAPRRMALVTSWHGERFHPGTIRMLATDRARLGQTAGTIARHARAMRYSGLVLDFEDLSARDVAAQLTVVRAIADSARAHGVSTIASAVPALDTLAYPARQLGRVVDFVIPMFYDEHWSGSSPGAVSSPEFVRRALAIRLAEVGADRLVAGLPTYGYRWIRGRPTEAIGMLDARHVASTTGARLVRDSATGALRASGADWDMWVTDVSALRRLVLEVRHRGVRRIALWRLGREDPAVWTALFP